MKVKTVSYQKVFPIAQFVNQKIGVEIEIDERDYEVGKDPEEEAIRLAKEMVNRWGTEQSLLQVDRNDPIPVVEIEKPLSQNDRIKQQIAQCSDVKVLESFKLLASKNTELLLAYNTRHAELSQKQTA